MNISNQEYSALAKQMSPSSKMTRTVPAAFAAGGTICAAGEVLRTAYGAAGFSEENAAMLTSLSLILMSVLLTGFKIYDRIAAKAGAGTLVPITGFANAVASPALDYKSEGFVTGLGVKMFTIAGPVIVYGVTASVVCGIFYYITTLF